MEAQERTEASPPSQAAGKVRHSPMILLLCVFSGVICVVFLFASVVVFAREKERRRQETAPTYCCPDVASQLVKAANFSLDPCTNYLTYTCYNWDAVKTQFVHNNSPAAIFRSAISGRYGSLAGKTVFAFHRSCLNTIGRGTNLPGRAMSALLETTNISRGMAPVDVLRVLIQLSVLYQLYTPIKVDVSFDVNSAVSALRVHSNPVLPFSESQFMNDQHDLLRTFNKELRVNVKTGELLGLKKKLEASNQKGQLYIVENFQLLDGLVANVSKHQWLAMAAPFYYFPPPTVLSYSDTDPIRETLGLLITDSSAGREVQLAFLLVTAGVHLIRNYRGRVPIGESVPLFLYCDGLTYDLVSCWRAIAKEELTDPQKNDVVRSLFRAIKNAVVGDMQKLFDPADWTAARSALSSVRLILQADLTPRSVSFPVLDEDFYSNLLKMLQHDTAEYKRLVDLGFNFFYFYSEFQTNLKPMGESTALMSSFAYYLLRFGKDTDPAINVADVGIQMAVFLWRVLFTYTEWMPATKTRMEDYHNCSTGAVSTSMNQRDLSEYALLRLSLSSAVNSVRTEGPRWHLPFYVWSISRLSRAQMFYMKFAAKYCPFARNNSVGITVNSLLPSIRDFREAYACPASVNSAGICSFEL